MDENTTKSKDTERENFEMKTSKKSTVALMLITAVIFLASVVSFAGQEDQDNKTI
jgi:hypothetical protein